LKALLARERARAEFQDWEKKEEEVNTLKPDKHYSICVVVKWNCYLSSISHFEVQFHFDQSKVRSEIRLREGRTKPIDVLLKNLSFSDEFDIELNEPYLVFKVSILCSSLPNSTEKKSCPSSTYLCNFLYVF
jgi:hypothetical protein